MIKSISISLLTIP